MSYESELHDLADAVRDFTNLEIPDVGEWNQNPAVLEDGLRTAGTFIQAVDAARAALEAKFLVDHASDGKNPLPPEWVVDGATPVFVNASILQLPGDRTADYAVGHRMRATVGSSQVVAAITSVTTGGGSTIITLDQPVLTSGLTAVARGLVRTSMPKVKFGDIMPGALLPGSAGEASSSSGVNGLTAVNSTTPVVLANPPTAPTGGWIGIFGVITFEDVLASLPYTGTLTVEVRRAGSNHLVFQQSYPLFRSAAGSRIVLPVPILAFDQPPPAALLTYLVQAFVTPAAAAVMRTGAAPCGSIGILRLT